LGQSHAVVTQVDPELEVKAAVLLGGSRNHYHWLVDYLPRLERLLAERELWGGAKLLVNAGLTAGQRDSLRLLGIGQDELLPVPDGTAVRAGRLLVTPVGTHAGKPRLETLAWLRAAFGIAGAPSGRRLYVSRSDASVRRVVNEAELVPALRKLGFEVVVPGRLSFEQQVAAFAGASVIVGPHGAGLTNMVFAPPGARVVELIAGRTPMVFFDALAESCGHAFRRLVCPSAQSPDARHEARVENHDMAAPVAELVALLKAL
jgi:capsular polysaccharide biosynthesis protein